MRDRSDSNLKEDLENAYNVAERALEKNMIRAYESSMKVIYRIEEELESRKKEVIAC